MSVIVTTKKENYDNIGAAIRRKNGSADKYYPSQMADAIDAIETGGVSLRVLTEGADGRIDVGYEGGVSLKRQYAVCTQYYDGSSYAGTSLTVTMGARVGDLLVAVIGCRPSDKSKVSVSDGWTLAVVSENNSDGSTNTILAVAYKVATVATESITITQDISGRMLCNLFSVKGATGVNLYGDIQYSWQNDGGNDYADVPKPSGLAMVCGFTNYWGGPSVWSASTGTMYSYADMTANRLASIVDDSTATEITINAGTTFSVKNATFLTLTFDGVDSFDIEEEIL